MTLSSDNLVLRVRVVIAIHFKETSVGEYKVLTREVTLLTRDVQSIPVRNVYSSVPYFSRASELCELVDAEDSNYL